MTHRYALVSLAVAALAVAGAGTTVVAEDVPADDAAVEDVATIVWLKGAFGRVSGGEPVQPATAAPDDRPLDTWMRHAPLELTTSVPFEDLVGLSVVAQAVDGEATEVLSTGATSFTGPDGVGRFLVTATIERDPGGTSEHAWLLEVPDRAGGPELLWDIPGVGASIIAASDPESSVPGVPGHGCYAYLCVEAGYRAPPASMEALTVTVGEAPTLRLDDGSAMVHWQGRLEPLSSPGTPAREAAATFTAQPVAATELIGLEPPTAGEWLLEVRADFDRERGWQWFLYRLIAE